MTPEQPKRKSRSNHTTKRNKRLRPELRRTPWRDQWELEAVGRALVAAGQPEEESNASSCALLSVEQALETVAVWRARSSALEELPHAVESTAALAQVYWRDLISKQTSYSISVTELRLSYSAVIVRCINGLADASQQQRFVAASVSALCGHLGVPSWLVDIRHEASHNALPTLGVLRLGASTLLEYLKNEYWIRTCPTWNSETKEADLEESQSEQQPIDFLLKYKGCATGASSPAEKTEPSNTTNRKQKSSKPTVTTRPLDPLFGDGDTDSSSDDDEDDDDDDPILGSISIWGSSIGTSKNRFSLLEAPSKPKSKKNSNKIKEKKPKTPKKKKNPDEKTPVDFAKAFVKAVSPLEGFSTALSFLVWGGIGGAPAGRGALIPGSAAAFPASQQGIVKSWQRYSPLIQVLGRAWPGFCPCLLVHLVDFVFSIEDTAVEQGTVDAGSARKLFFLSAWIRLLLSQSFVSQLDPEPYSKTNKRSGTELILAQSSHLEKLEYPLNSLCDRIVDCNNNNADLRKTSCDLLRSLEQILGDKRVRNFGITAVEQNGSSTTSAASEKPETLEDPMTSEQQCTSQVAPDQSETKAAEASKMSLDELEAMLSNDDPVDAPVVVENRKKKYLDRIEALFASANRVNTVNGANEKHTSAKGEALTNESVHANESRAQAPLRLETRPAWVLCKAWDPCSIGTLPGYPV